tara:strand:+ start:1994 stop:2644 length:651 start_codon:yes stop_codon:yes gene_type:complete
MISKNLKKRLYTSFFLFLLIYVIFKISLIFVYSLIVIGVLSILEFLNITKKFISKKINFILVNFFFISFIFFFLFTSLFFYSNLQSKMIIFSLLLCCVASDVGGFIFGKLLKGPKLTKISPNKTVAGACGSLILSCMVLSILFYFLSINLNLQTILVAMITSISCQIGDLLFSYLKRKAKIKDTGNLLPGHGGILDRLDGILLGIPLGILGVLYLY